VGGREATRGVIPATWARQDPDVLAQYAGELVVPYKPKIVAHGKDAARVLAEAAQITGRPAGELPLMGVVEPLLDMQEHGVSIACITLCDTHQARKTLSFEEFRKVRDNGGESPASE
jgi:hypothetical protein